jgi:peroxiredoxin/flagellar biosynthesis chaperone FliJ
MLMKSSFFSAPGVILWMVLSTSGLCLGAVPTSRPANAREHPGAGINAILDRASNAVDQISSVTDAQKEQIEQILNKAHQDAEQLGKNLSHVAPRERGRQVGDFLQGVRRDIAQVLNRDQLEQLRQKLEPKRQGQDEKDQSDERSADRKPGADRKGAVDGGPVGRFAQRVRQDLFKLNLSDEQQAKVRSLFEDVKKKADAIREQAGDDAAGARQKARQLFEETRGKLRDILTPQQQEKMRDLARSGPDRRSSGDRARDRRDRPDADSKASTRASDQTSMMDSTDVKDRKSTSSGPDDQAMDPLKGPAVGEAAPELSLGTLDGHHLTLSALKGRLVVLVFGSYSSPSFRQRAASIEKLSNDLGIRARVYIVYGREAHAAGEWDVDRNKEQEIKVKQPSTMDARQDLAKTARKELKLSVPIAIDTIDNTAARAFGAGENSAYLIGRDGKILARQRWFEPSAMQRDVDKAAASKAPLAN